MEDGMLTRQNGQRLPLAYRLLFGVVMSSGSSIVLAVGLPHPFLWELGLFLSGTVAIFGWPEIFGSPDIRRFLIHIGHRFGKHRLRSTH